MKRTFGFQSNRSIFYLCGLLLTIICCDADKLTAQNTSVADPDPSRFKEAIETFDTWDKKNSFPGQAVLFVGSSSIRLWHTSDAFPGLAVINRGFGGAHTSDVLYYYSQVVFRYKPSIIVLYAGDNDIAAGKPALQVYNDVLTFFTKVHEDLPESKVIFLSIKPSPARWSYWKDMQNTNKLIEQYAENNPLLYFADMAKPLLTDEGTPDNKLFLSDKLHLNQKGYTSWEAVLTPLLEAYFPQPH